jgi:ABC-2 type transport system ATP-binding protein
MMDAIAVKDLTKHYEGLPAVDHISFRVEVGKVFGFLGPNGAGKTTTIRMLVGLTTPTEGSATVAGFDIRDEIVEVKRRVGVVPETSNLYDELSVRDNLIFASRLYHVPRRKRAERVRGLLETFQLQERSETRFGGLSKGLKRRVTIAAALVHSPEIVFMDEPTAGLDVMSALSLRNFIGELRREETTVFLTTHYIQEADQLCDRIGIIVKGKIVTVDTPENIKAAIDIKPIVEALLSGEPDSSMVDALKEHGEVHHRDRKIKVVTDDVMATLESLLSLASERDIRLEDVTTSKPSLEEAFVRLTGVSSDVMKLEKEGRRG